MWTVLRSLGAWFAGAVIGVVTVLGFDNLSHLFFPPPPGLDLADPGQLAQLFNTMPPAAFGLLVAGWTIAAFLGSLTGALLASRLRGLVGALAGGLTFAGTLLNLSLLPHPFWVNFAAPLLVGGALVAGAWLGGRRWGAAGSWLGGASPG